MVTRRLSWLLSLFSLSTVSYCHSILNLDSLQPKCENASGRCTAGPGGKAFQIMYTQQGAPICLQRTDMQVGSCPWAIRWVTCNSEDGSQVWQYQGGNLVGVSVFSHKLHLSISPPVSPEFLNHLSNADFQIHIDPPVQRHNFQNHNRFKKMKMLTSLANLVRSLFQDAKAKRTSEFHVKSRRGAPHTNRFTGYRRLLPCHTTIERHKPAAQLLLQSTENCAKLKSLLIPFPKYTVGLYRSSLPV